MDRLSNSTILAIVSSFIYPFFAILGQIQEAIVHYKKTLQIKPDVIVYFCLADTLGKQGTVDKQLFYKIFLPFLRANSTSHSLLQRGR